MKIRMQLRHYVAQRVAMKGGGALLGDGSPLFSSGLLDSLDAVEMIIYAEEQFGINFAEISFDLTLLDSVNALCSLISGKCDRLDRV